MSPVSGQPEPSVSAAVLARPPADSGIAVAGPASGFFRHWMRLAAALVGALYLAMLAIGWISTAPAGHEGIMRTHEEARTDDGIIVGEVAPDSPADRAGLRPGDVILAIDGIPATDGDAINDRYHRQRAGNPTTVLVRRAGAPVTGPPESVDTATAPIHGEPRGNLPPDSPPQAVSVTLLS